MSPENSSDLSDRKYLHVLNFITIPKSLRN